MIRYDSETKRLFKSDPFQYLHSNELRRTFGSRFNSDGFRREEALGFVALFSERMDDIVRGKNPYLELSLTPYNSPSLGHSIFRLDLQTPPVEQLQKLLDFIAMYHFDERIPGGEWQLQFDVQPDYTITVATISKEPSRFGCFYRKRTKPLNP